MLLWLTLKIFRGGRRKKKNSGMNLRKNYQHKQIDITSKKCIAQAQEKYIVDKLSPVVSHNHILKMN